ncbi:MAG: amidohydrolase [Bacteroidales bacterium]|nr:amidohydrolase [Bacteroidales bacterium]MDD3907334.1 amidohydrolase [Bacteroidales bacterium]MDD4713115.1 amidohydrolase [Bacteroidales bacterium]
MRISLIQKDIIWEHKSANLTNYDSLLSGLSRKTDLVVLPEMCTTGFSMQAAQLAEANDGETMKFMRQMARDYGFAITGSFIGKGYDEANDNFNRGFFICPDGRATFYDKRHLFRMGEEPEHYQAGNDKCLINYMGWNIRLVICYDLRFPIWCRNTDNEYDLLVVVANWPETRAHAWQSLLTARAVENMAYVCGVNRVGTDGLKIKYSGDSQLINAYGSVLSSVKPGIEQIQTLEIDKDSLNRFRKKFPVWKDADKFEIL